MQARCDGLKIHPTQEVGADSTDVTLDVDCGPSRELRLHRELHCCRAAQMVVLRLRNASCSLSHVAIEAAHMRILHLDGESCHTVRTITIE